MSKSQPIDAPTTKTNVFGATIEQMDFDFNAEAVEGQLPTEYPESAPHDYDEDDDLP